MFYKIIYNTKIIDVVEKPKFFRIVNNKPIACSKFIADGILGSDKQKYILQSSKGFAGKLNKYVKLETISHEEFLELRNLLTLNKEICSDKELLNNVRKEIINKMSALCKDKITQGINIVLSDGLYHNFRLTIEDQLNLANIQQMLPYSGNSIVYHETGCICKRYSRADMTAILTEVAKHKSYHTTYFNLLKHCINNMNNIDDIKDITYGVNLMSLNVPNHIKSMVQEIMNG